MFSPWRDCVINSSTCDSRQKTTPTVKPWRVFCWLPGLHPIGWTAKRLGMESFKGVLRLQIETQLSSKSIPKGTMKETWIPCATRDLKLAL